MQRPSEIETALRAFPQERALLIRPSRPEINVRGQDAHGHYLRSLAAALILYTDEAPQFAAKLHLLVTTTLKHLQTPNPIRRTTPEYMHAAPMSVTMLLPQSDTDALQRAQWLLKEISRQIRTYSDGQKAPEALSLLRAWQEQYQEAPAPKQLVVGVVRIAIPGISLGRLRRSHQQMPIVVDRTSMNMLSSRTMAQTAGEAAMTTFFHELTGVGGSTRRLEPDVGDWFFGERSLAFYQTEAGSLNAFAGELERLAVPHATAWHQGTLAIVAASPSVTGMHHLSRWGIEPMS